MQLAKFVARIDRMVSLIEKECTGTAEEFASKVGLKRRMLFDYLDYLRSEKGLRIFYCRVARTYKLKK